MRTFFSGLGICIILVWAYSAYNRELLKEDLIKQKSFLEAGILELKCGRKDYIIIKYQGVARKERIYLNDVECRELKKQKVIKVKVDSEDNLVFARLDYNDNSMYERYAIFLIAFFLIGFIYLTQIRPGSKEY